MFGDLGTQAFNALKHNRRRSVLTMLGMAWGIATVVLLLSYGSGFQAALMVAFRTFGGNLVGIFPGRTSIQAGGTKAGAQIRLTRDDLDYLRAEVPMLTRISPEVDKQSQVSFGTRSFIITAGLKILLGFIGTLTLGIGGVGLMNIMLVSVTQRTREIGVEKALGGRRRDILFQFLAEALAITASVHESSAQYSKLVTGCNSQIE
jgi:ABC-type antimicrobial peptide transport system permease subunit